MRRPQRGGETVRIAGFFQQFARLGWIVRPGFIAGGEVNRRWQRAFRRHGIAGKGDLDQRVFIDGVVQRLAHLQVIERLLGNVHADVTLQNRRGGNHVQLAVFLQDPGLLVRDRESERGFAGLQHRGTGIVVDDRAPGDAVELRQPRFPVAVKFLHFNKIGLIPGLKQIRPGAHRVEADVIAVFLQRGG